MSDTTLQLREDLVAAHAAVVASLGAAGTWWTSAERIEIASQVRRALGHADLPPWERPTNLDGLVGRDSVLGSTVIDAIWRITNHPGTLTQRWYTETVDGFESPYHYVEMAGIVSMMNAIDRFADIVDVARIDLPEPGNGEPSRAVADGSVIATHWVPTAINDGPNIRRSLSAVPADADFRTALSAAQYVPPEAVMDDLDWARGNLDRRQIELVAASTSLANECFY